MKFDSIEFIERLARLETQVARLVSDAESEKETRRRVNAELTKRLDQINGLMQTVNDQMNRGKGVAVGMLFAAGGVGSAITTAITKVLGM